MTGRKKGVKNTAKYGEGTEIQNPSGSWSRWVMIDGKRYKRTAPTRTAVRAKIAELRKQIALDGHRSVSAKRAATRSAGRTVTQVVDEWLATEMPAGKGERPLAAASQDRHRYAADHVRRLLGDIPVRELTTSDVAGAFAQLATEGQSRASIVKVCNTLSLSLQRAMVLSLVDRNVAADRKHLIPAQARRTAPRKSLSPTEARTLLEELRTERNGLAFALSLRLGLRPGEAWALHWGDVGTDSVNITRGIRRSGGTASIGDELKTESSKRTIMMPSELTEWFADHRRDQLAERLAAPAWHDDRLVFAGPSGRLVDPSLSRKLLSGICERLGITRVRPNELRHSCASLLSDEGIPNELIADLLGHTTTRMVDQTYRHRLRPEVDVAARATWAESS